MKKLILSVLLGALVLITPQAAFASEGQTLLTNRVGEAANCWVGSVLMRNDSFEILFSCRNITYPGGTEVFSYVLWSNPLNGGDPVKLGTIGFGKGEFTTKSAFSSLFITKEESSNPKTPSSAVVMQGNVQALPGLTSATPSPGQPATPTPEGELPSVETPIPTMQPRSGIAKFLTGGILAVLGIAGLIFIIFIITKK